MDNTEAIAALAALAQTTRLDTFRLLVKREPDGVPAGELARLMAVPQNTMSAHLAILARAGLVIGERHSRSIIYRADLARSARSRCSFSRTAAAAVPTSARRSSPISPPAASRRFAPMTDRVFNVLFLCTGNTARSILAESILRKDGAGRFNAFSAGSHPKGAVNPFALKTLEAYGYPTDGFRSKNWEEFADARRAENGFRVHGLRQRGGRSLSGLAGTADDRALGHRRPGGGRRHGYRERARLQPAFRYLRNRIILFIALPIKSLDKLSLTKRLREIGETEGATHAREKA